MNTFGFNKHICLYLLAKKYQIYTVIYEKGMKLKVTLP